MDTWYRQYKTAESYWTIDQVYTDDNNLSYDVTLLIKVTKDHEVKEEDAESFKDMLSNDTWGLGYDKLTPLMVLEDPERDKEYKKHFKRIKKANLNKPILVREEGGEVIDGYHRLCRAFLEKKMLKVIEVSEEDLKKTILGNFTS